MIIEEIKNIKSDKKQIKDFSIVMCIAFALLGGLLFWKGNDAFRYLWVVSGMFLFFGICISVILKPLYTIWMVFSIILGYIMTRIILIILFYVIITPIGVIGKIFGKDFLDRKIDRNSNSYWINRKDKNLAKESYENQF